MAFKISKPNEKPSNSKFNVSNPSEQPDPNQLQGLYPNPQETIGSGKYRYSTGGGGSGLGTGRYSGQQTAVYPGQEISALDEIAEGERVQKGELPERYEYEPEKEARAKKLAERMTEAWDALPQAERDRWLNKGTASAVWHGIIDGVSPIPPSWVQSPEKLAKLAVLQHNNQKAFDRSSAAGLAMSLFITGAGFVKGGKAVADIAFRGPRGGRRAASRAFNEFAEVFQKSIDDVKANNESGQKLLNATAETSDEVIERLSLNRDSLRRFDQKVHDLERRFGVKQSREFIKDDLADRALIDRSRKLQAKGGQYYQPDLIRTALQRNGLDPNDVYKNILEGDTVAKRQVVNAWQDYVTAPISNFLRGTIERLPGRAVEVISGLAGGAASSFVYAFEYAYTKKGYTSEEAIAFALNAATDVALEDLTTVGNIAGTVEDFQEGGRYNNRGGLVAMNKGGGPPPKHCLLYTSPSPRDS